jgi:hypothetical protein
MCSANMPHLYLPKNRPEPGVKPGRPDKVRSRKGRDAALVVIGRKSCAATVLPLSGRKQRRCIEVSRAQTVRFANASANRVPIRAAPLARVKALIRRQLRARYGVRRNAAF